MPQVKSAKKSLGVSWWRLIVGAVLAGLGMIFIIIYFGSDRNILAGFMFALTFAPGAFLLYTGLKTSESSYSFTTKARARYTGKENAIIIYAKRKVGEEKDVPVIIRFANLSKIPEGARLHYVRNLKKHFYELENNTKTKKLETVILPDKKPVPPELFKIPAAMQPYKDCMDFNPPSTLQKVAPAILLGAMGIVGLLMVMTGG